MDLIVFLCPSHWSTSLIVFFFKNTDHYSLRVLADIPFLLNSKIFIQLYVLTFFGIHYIMFIDPPLMYINPSLPQINSWYLIGFISQRLISSPQFI